MIVKQTIGELTLNSFGEISKHEIAWIPAYGVTCSSLFTSNGSLEVVARGLESRLNVAQMRADIPDRDASLLIDGKAVVAGSVEKVLKSAFAKARNSFLAAA